MSLTFTITEDHLKLLRSAYVRWEDCEYGAPAIDCKRPYGNSSVELDIAEILGWDIDEDDDGMTQDQRDAARQIHLETEAVLQIILSSGIMEAGVYERPDGYSVDWVKVAS